MKKNYLYSVIAMLAFAGCQETDVCGIDNTTNESIAQNEVELTVDIDESSTRTYVGEDKDDDTRMLLWESNDTIAVFYGHKSPSLFTVKSIEGDGTQAKFRCSNVNREGDVIGHYVGLYPYDANASIEYINKEYIITTTFPSEQYYKENSFGHAAAPMMAVAPIDGSLSFKNMCTSVKIRLKGSTGTEKISKIEVFSRDGRPMAGQWTYSLPVSGALKDIKITPADEGTVDMITLYCGEGITLGSEEKGFIFTMPPMFFDDNQLIFRVYDEDGRYKEIVKVADFDYVRSKIIEVGPYDYEKPTYAASVAGEVYESIEEAITVALDPESGNDVELKIYKDIVLGAASSQANALSCATREEDITLESDYEDLGMESLNIPVGKKLILNLNGHTIRGEKECTKSFQMISNKGTLIITGDGKISFKDTGEGDPTFGWGSYTIRNEGTLIVENGTIEHLGEQNKPGDVKHMICAIFQYSGSTTIYGGTISTPTYRSARLWKGDMTINGGDFGGQLWVQAVDNTSKLTINGGTFAPRGGDGSSVFVTNDTYNVDFAVTGGYFNTKIGSSSPTNFTEGSGMITGGTFTETAKGKTNPYLLASGYEFVENSDGTYDVKPIAE